MRFFRCFCTLLFGLVLSAAAHASTTTGSTKHRSAGTTRAVAHGKAHVSTAHAAKRSTASSRNRTAATTGTSRRGAHATLAVRRTRRSRYYEHFTGNSFADNLTLGDVTEGEDPVVRQAAIEALGNMNGTAVAIDPSSGRILAMVNQKLALSRGAEPCSTIKLSVALAALEEGIVTKDTPVNLGRHYSMTMTDALAHSNNLYFETLGRTLGFERVKHYANEFGLGELAGYNIKDEQLGIYPDEELPAKLGGVGRMCSFGESVSMTPLQLGALVSAIANGGTLYYLQHPETKEDIESFTPKVKRVLNIAPLIPEIQDGMLGATSYG
ncbi:MAG TPA: penicillin-binding transpeptidase domain-containing protein, partial [Edaphobacter sp.]